MIYHIQNNTLQLEYCPEEFKLTVKQGNTQWQWKEIPSILLENEPAKNEDGTYSKVIPILIKPPLRTYKSISFAGTQCESNLCKTGITDGVRATYRGFTDGETEYPFVVDTFVGLDVTTGDLRVEMSLHHDAPGQLHGVCYPPAFHFDAKEGEGYTLLSRMQGTILPAGHPLEVPEGMIFERDAYMPIYAQVKGNDGYLAIYDTPYDARYQLKNGQMQPMFITSLGTMNYKRTMLYAFRENCDMNTFAAIYRNYLKERGGLVTLQEKIVRNPRIAELIGTPIVHSSILYHTEPSSCRYDAENPANNDHCVSFATRAEQLRALKAKGVEKVYLHLDGWGKRGYDNLHPDLFPPYEAAGGADGMRQLQQTCTELGYLFGVHDQYRDYYYDAESFSLDNTITNLYGAHPYCNLWAGGSHSHLCAVLTPEYVRRNYDTFEQLGIKIDGSYLDVFSVIELDECFHPQHPMTREQCAKYRRECFDALTARGIIPSSEEMLGCIVDSHALCHHVPFLTSGLYETGGGAEVGISVPLLSLVYHDCLIAPWFAPLERGGWGIPETEMGYLWALLTGGTVYCNIDETGENLPHLQIALDLHRQVALSPLTRHEFIDSNIRQRRSIFADGTVVEANLDTTAFEIRYPDGRVVRSDKQLA